MHRRSQLRATGFGAASTREGGPAIGKIPGKYKNLKKSDFAVYGTWEALVGCKIAPRDMGTFSTIGETLVFVS